MMFYKYLTSHSTMIHKYVTQRLFIFLRFDVNRNLPIEVEIRQEVVDKGTHALLAAKR